jgi:excisionase family DNA binding protein
MQKFVVQKTTPEWGEWLTYAQAQSYSGLSRTRLWELIGNDEIQAAHVGRAVRISRASLQQFMEKSSQVA